MTMKDVEKELYEQTKTKKKAKKKFIGFHKSLMKASKKIDNIVK